MTSQVECLLNLELVHLRVRNISKTLIHVSINPNRWHAWNKVGSLLAYFADTMAVQKNPAKKVAHLQPQLHHQLSWWTLTAKGWIEKKAEDPLKLSWRWRKGVCIRVCDETEFVGKRGDEFGPFRCATYKSVWAGWRVWHLVDGFYWELNWMWTFADAWLE